MPRFVWLLPPAAAGAVFALARHLTPDPSGMGTHRSLGLPGCPLLTLTGIFCPSCGLTTSFSHLAHGHWSAAWKVHPLGPALFLLFAWVSLVSLLEFAQISTPMGRWLKKDWTNLAYGGVFLFLGTWIVRLALHYGRMIHSAAN